MRPAVLGSVSSSGMVSWAFATRPALVLSESASSSAAASTFFEVTSDSSVQTSVSLYSSFTTSCSTFSRESPYSLTSLVLPTASFLFAAFEFSDSSSVTFGPTWMDGLFFTSTVIPTSFLLPCHRYLQRWHFISCSVCEFSTGCFLSVLFVRSGFLLCVLSASLVNFGVRSYYLFSPAPVPSSTSIHGFGVVLGLTLSIGLGRRFFRFLVKLCTISFFTWFYETFRSFYVPYRVFSRLTSAGRFAFMFRLWSNVTRRRVAGLFRAQAFQRRTYLFVYSRLKRGP